MTDPGPEGPSAPTCGSCGAEFAAFRAEAGVGYRCGACDAWIGAPASRTAVRFVYPVRKLRSTAAPRPFGRYVLHDELGRGGMGSVVRAWDGDQGLFVALKFPHRGGMELAAPGDGSSPDPSGPERLDRFLREASAASRLRHPNLIAVRDTGWIGGSAYFTMDLVEGPSLLELLAARGALDKDEALRITAAVARGLAAAHAEGLVHRDVKPANILLTPDGEPVLTDFGLAADPFGAQLTRSGQLLGTPSYMAPEQALSDGRTADARTDQYALGAVLYELLTGEPPYVGDSAVSVLRRIAEGPPTPVERRRRGIGPALAVVVQQAMARNPARRYADLGAFAEDLERCRRGERVRARPPNLRDRLVDLWLRRRQQAIGAGIAAMAGVVLLSVGLLARDVLRTWAEDDRERAAADQYAVAAMKLASLRATDPEGTARELYAFAMADEHRGTGAATAALIDRAALLSRTPGEPGLAAWADVYAAARAPADQDRALRGLAEQFRAAWRWDALLRVGDALVARNPAAHADPTVARWRAEARLATHRLQDAASIASSANLVDAPLLSALTQAAAVPDPLPGSAAPLGVVSGIDGGEAWWLAWRAGLPKVAWRGHRSLDIGLPVVPAELVAVTGAPGWVVARDPDGAAALVDLRVQDLVPTAVVLARWPSSVVLAAAREGDTVWVGTGPPSRQLLRVTPGVDGVETPAAEVDAATSDVTGVLPWVHDGRAEVLVTLGPWSAYEVRTLAPTGTGWERVARRKLGFVQAPALARAGGGVWVAKGDRYPSAMAFPPDVPYGEAPGAYLLGGDAPDLPIARFLAATLPRGGSGLEVGRVFEPDLDGDGAREVVFGMEDGERTGTAITRGDGPSWTLAGAVPLAVVAADGDDADELLVQVGGAPARLYVLGTGTDGLPIGPEAPAVDAVPALDSLARTRAWVRAEELVGMGLYARAQAELVSLAEASPRAVAPLAWRRAAELAERLDDDGAAANLYAHVGDPGSLRLAAAQHLRGHRFAQAVDALDLAGASRDEHRELRDQVRATIAARVPLAAAAVDPLVAAPEGADVRVTLFADDRGDAIAVPFTWDGRRLGLEVDLTLTRLEWASGIVVELAPVAEGSASQDLTLAVTGWGGGERLERELRCASSLGASVARRTAGTAEDRVDLHLAVDWSAAGGDLRCNLGASSGPQASTHANLSLPRALPGGAWRLRVRASDHGGVDAPALAVAVVHGMTLTASGLVLLPPDAVSSTLAPAERDVAQALAAVRQGDLAAARTRLEGVLRRDPDAAEVVRALRLDPVGLGAVLQDIVGAREHAALFERAFGVVIDAHPDDAVVARALTTGLSGLEGLAAAAEPEVRARAGRLLAARGRAWASLGERGAARRDLLAATGVADVDWGADGPLRGLPAAWIALAELDVSDGASTRAVDALARAVASSPAPELVGDLLLASPVLAPLARDPAVAEVLGGR